MVTLYPGMALSVEIKTGQRRFIEFFFSPVLKYGQESIPSGSRVRFFVIIPQVISRGFLCYSFKVIRSTAVE